ncbi:MAG: type VI secretion system baseplate subunit TssF, partial [Alphaproteobacteria bacterium]|nr:type VI secretion system baseplate subunit TssF [Alphaproteobacteria bacterium]
AYAQNYPKIARRLELGPDQSADPNVERLIESFAFLTARIQRNFEADFPEISGGLLGLLYPQFAAPIPSAAIARFDVDPAQVKLTSGYVVAAGTPVFAGSAGGHVCRFRTCYPVTLWPVTIEHAGFETADRYGFLDRANVAVVLRVSLRAHGANFRDLELNSLRFRIEANAMVANGLYALMFSALSGVAVVTARGKAPLRLGPDAVAPVGFGDDEAVLPYPSHAQPAYRLLQEYFHFLDKFLFFDVHGLGRADGGETLDLLFLFDRAPRERLAVDRDTLALGATPIVNLFSKTSEPLRLTHRASEYKLIPDLRRERACEIHTVLGVSASSDPGDPSRLLTPFFSFDHTGAEKGGCYWHARRQPTDHADMAGTDVWLSFLDLDLNPSIPAAQTVFAHTLCTNRSLAEQMSAGTVLDIEAAVPVTRVICVTKPTVQTNPALGGETYWRLISQLSLNHLSLSGGAEGLAALREILRLHCGPGDATSEQQIAGLRGLSATLVARRLGRDAWRGFCRGLAIKLEIDEEKFVGANPVLLAAVLNRFFALYASINAFTELTVVGIQPNGLRKSWPPMTGARPLL